MGVACAQSRNLKTMAPSVACEVTVRDTLFILSELLETRNAPELCCGVVGNQTVLPV
jgi:hypothetical protein